MNKNWFAKSLSIAAGFILLFCEQGAARACITSQGPVQASSTVSPGPAPESYSLPDYFAGLTYTDDEKARIANIRNDMKRRKDTVAREDSLTQDQKDSMIRGYAHMENSEIFQVLTPEQRRQVRQRLKAAGAKDQAPQKKQPRAN